MVSECFLFLICIQQLPKLNASAANIIKVVAMEASSIHTSDLVESVITTIPRGHWLKIPNHVVLTWIILQVMPYW